MTEEYIFSIDKLADQIVSYLKLHDFNRIVCAIPVLGRRSFATNWQYQYQTKYTECITNSNGTVVYKLNDELHRLDGPAIEFHHGGREYYRYGVRHRCRTPCLYLCDHQDGPAVLESGREEYYINGKRHREDGPAIIDNGAEYYFINNRLHRDDNLPAIELDNGVQIYYTYGVCTKIIISDPLGANSTRAYILSNILHAFGVDTALLAEYLC